MLDFDQMAFKTVKYWALRTMRWFKLGGLLVLKSSPECYHVVFNRTVSWTENMKVVAWVALQSRCESLTQWLLMQCIKGASTLRVSPKREKPAPRIVYRYGQQADQIHAFLRYRYTIKCILRKLAHK
jgi:hypothetical protein